MIIVGLSGRTFRSAYDRYVPVPARGLAILLGASPVLVWAQDLPSGPVSLGDGRVVLGADVAVNDRRTDEAGWFNYTDYEHNTLRMFRMALSGVSGGQLHPLALVGEIRTENIGHVSRTRSICACVRGEIVPIRHPGRPHPADLRRVRPPRVFEPTIRSSDIRSPTST